MTDQMAVDTGLKRQEDFYKNYLKAYERKQRVIVIISDAFRYECAKELMDTLELDEKCTPKLKCMLKRDKLQEFDKVSFDKVICTYLNKRFLLTTQVVDETGMESRIMAYLKHLYVTTPIGADVFKVAGGGQNYAYGGSSLQEMLVSVIGLTTNTRGVAYDYVNVRLILHLWMILDFRSLGKVKYMAMRAEKSIIDTMLSLEPFR